MPFPVLGSNSAVAGYEIDNSLRFNYPDSAKLSFTPSSSGNDKTATASFWLKRGVSRASNDLHIMGSQQDGSNLFSIRIRSSGNSDIFQFLNAVSGSTSNGFTYKSTAAIRDHSAWYHFVVAIDVTQSDSNNGLKLYVNGVLQTSNTIGSYNQNVGVSFNTSGEAMKIGIKSDDSDPFDGYLADFYWIDGTQKQATDFGEYNDNGVWIPKAYEGSYGTNGFKLEFKDSGNLGDDTSGNGNDFTATNLTATDQTTDTPTNNFCTMSPIDTNTQASLSEGNTQLQRGSNYAGCNGTFGVANGKWYWEIKTPSPTTSGENSGFGVSKVPHATIGNNYLGINTNSWAILIDNADSDIYKIHNNSTTDYGVNASSNDIFQIALDMDNNKIYFGRNGTFFASGDPVGNSNEAYSSVSGDPFLLPAFSMNGNDTLQANFGNAPFSISSGNSDANGYGNFEYAVPSGYYSLCTKNLAEYG